MAAAHPSRPLPLVEPSPVRGNFAVAAAPVAGDVVGAPAFGVDTAAGRVGEGGGPTVLVAAGGVTVGVAACVGPGRTARTPTMITAAPARANDVHGFVTWILLIECFLSLCARGTSARVS